MNNEEKIISMLETLAVKVDRIETDIAEVKSDIVGVKSDIVGIKSDIVGIKSDVVIIKKQQAVDSDSIDNIYKAVSDLRSDYDSHSHDTNRPKIAAI